LIVSILKYKLVNINIFTCNINSITIIFAVINIKKNIRQRFFKVYNMANTQLSPWQRFVGLLQLERKDIFQILYYAVFGGIVTLSLPLGIQSIINLIQGAQVSTSWVVLVILVTIGVVFSGALQ
jgi:hypothetical protein